ncbi:MAG: hypothetical protein PHT83_02720 [Bacilli bacterium]|nr:hypothetical protein [Bacilli bacterium]
MVITIFDVIKEFIINLLSSSQWKNVLILLSGIITGFVLSGAIYALIVVASIKKDKKETKAKREKEKTQENCEEEKVRKLVVFAKNEFKEDCSTLDIKEKFVEVKYIAVRLIEDIAKVYHPKSNHPLYELSVDEVIQLNKYITERVNEIFDRTALRFLRKQKISSVLNFFDTKKKIEESKANKMLTKFKITDTINFSRKVINVFNPAFWTRKLINGVTIPKVTNKIALTVIDIVAEETNKIYSKSVFGVENKIDTAILENVDEIDEIIQENSQ